VRPARNRKEGQEQALHARHFHRPVEPDHQHRDEGDDEGDHAGRKAEGTCEEGRRGATEALRERGERRQSLPEEPQQRDRAGVQRRAGRRVMLGHSRGKGTYLLDEHRDDKQPHEDESGSKEKID